METLVAQIGPRQRLIRMRAIDRDQSMISAAQSSYITDGRHLIFGALVRGTSGRGETPAADVWRWLDGGGLEMPSDSKGKEQWRRDGKWRYVLQTADK